MIASPLIPSMIEGSATKTARGWAQMVELNPRELSVDPDSPEDKVNDTYSLGRQVEEKVLYSLTKQQPSMLPGPAVPGSSLVSLHFLWAILCPQAVTCFLRVPQAVGLNCSCHAAQASKGNFQKTCYKTFFSTCRPRL